jgi:hypothetical protein
MMSAHQPRNGRPTKQRWECHCGEPAILLGMYDSGGQIQIKVRDRYYETSGCIHATCPRCGTKHVLDLRPASTAPDPPVDPVGWG